MKTIVQLMVNIKLLLMRLKESCCPIMVMICYLRPATIPEYFSK